MAVQGRRGTIRSSTYDVRGATLAQINRMMQRNGPVDQDGRRRPGAFSGTFVIAIGERDTRFETTSAGPRARVTCTLGGGTVSGESVIVLPRLTGGGLSSAAQAEWERFLIALDRHEKGHVDELVAEAVSIAGELASMSATGQGRDERGAQQAAHAALLDAISRTFPRSVLERRSDAAAARYDARNGHGRTQGAVLDASIP